MIAKPDTLEVYICILAMPMMIEGGGDACRFKGALYGFKSEGTRQIESKVEKFRAHSKRE